MKEKMYMPENKKLQPFLLQQHHNLASQIHSSYKTMFQKLQENWFWFGMAKHCKQYASSCSICKRSKAYNTQQQSFFNPLPVSNKKWVDLLLNFIIQLSECRRQNWTFQHILMIIDHFTKRQIYEPLKMLATSKFIAVMYKRVFSFYRFSISIVNDQGG